MKKVHVIGVLVAFLVGCGGASMMNTAGSNPSLMADTDPLTTDVMVDDTSSQGSLPSITTIGSTVDPKNGDQNPYGLDVARASAGLISTGDLVVCNFNDSANIQGNGTTVIALHPTPGATPLRVAQDAQLKGCNALALGPTDNSWTANFSANTDAIISPTGSIISTLPGGPWHRPFGQAFSPTAGPFGVAAFYESNASDGSIVRVNISSTGAFTFDVIATGFPVNNGAPGSILGPSGLQYDANRDRLYIVDGQCNALYALRHVSTIPAGGVTLGADCKTFGGPFMHRAKLIYMGAPLNGPISAALLGNEHIVLGNTLDPNGQNLMVELTPGGHVRSVRNVDTGNAGALFGMVAVPGEAGAHQGIYFNDDNDNTVKVVH